MFLVTIMRKRYKIITEVKPWKQKHNFFAFGLLYAMSGPR